MDIQIDFAMKVLHSLLISSLIIVSISCSLGNDDWEPANLYGTWEAVGFHEETGLDFVTAYIFRENGTFEQQMIARRPNSSNVVGFNSIISGTYALEGDRLTFFETNWLNLPENREQWYTTLADLVDVDWNRERPVTLTLRSRNTELEMDFGPCPPNALCQGPVTFYRVDN